ncbi:hypothetical protein LOK49_LG12G00333 [Camellia lanceoleosa]|uniref:Uncharacterized protein n=1 Tax=Camellia lanceoleosa TaxID=1840588 RepID=A0ACC0FSG0_9ERIC|nr:hypothetical protein LOK49_LG12G00333 [Camellia lanceoleosa]
MEAISEASEEIGRGKFAAFGDPFLEDIGGAESGFIVFYWQSLVKGMEKNGESSESDSYVSYAIASQVRRLAMEVRQLASTRQITVLNGNSGQIGNMTSLIVPAVAVGALSYGYM